MMLFHRHDWQLVVAKEIESSGFSALVSKVETAILYRCRCQSFKAETVLGPFESEVNTVRDILSEDARLAPRDYKAQGGSA